MFESECLCFSYTFCLHFITSHVYAVKSSKFKIPMHAFLPYVEMKCCNLLFDIDVLLPIFLSWMTTFYSVFLVQYINQPFSDQILHFLCTDLYFIFFFVPQFLFFSSALLFPFPISSFSLCVHLPFPCLFPNAHSLPCLILLFSLSLSSFPVSIPYVHASVLEQMFLGPTCPN